MRPTTSTRTTGRLLTCLVTAGVLAGGTAVAPAGAAEEEPLFLGWTGTLPPRVASYSPTSEDDCTAGRIACVDKVIREMERRLRPLAEACSHHAIFSLAYLRTTETYREAAVEPGFFTDPSFVNHEDVVFAEYYFAAYDDWAAGRRHAVPEAWRIAFDGAEARRVSGGTNFLLGINAHVNRDLPYVLASIGLVAPDGSSRKPDHDQVNVFLNRVTQPLIAELAARFDPSMDDTSTPLGLSYTATMQLLVSWREEAWRNAERLVAAPDAEARARVVGEIELAAAQEARALLASGSYLPPLHSSAVRDAHCAAAQAAETSTGEVG